MLSTFNNATSSDDSPRLAYVDDCATEVDKTFATLKNRKREFSSSMDAIQMNVEICKDQTKEKCALSRSGSFLNSCAAP